MNKGTISNLLRNLKVIYWVDWLRFYFQKFKNRKINQAFKKEYPQITLPPDYLIYESFQINYQKYYLDSKGTAEWLKGYWENHIELKNINILDWGCGPGRVIRHLPEVIGNGCAYYGTDYNAQSIQWCQANLQGIEFNLNALEAKLPYPDGFFGVIYGISIFTHLSEQMHHNWFKELHRVLKTGGIMFLTTHGNNFKVKLDASEQATFDSGKLVVRGKVKEGHRTFAAFQPKAFMQSLFSKVQILEHLEPAPEKGKWLPQDIWIIKK